MVIIKYIIRFITYGLYKAFCMLLNNEKKARNNFRVLVQINSGIGNCIMALPMIHKLKAQGYDVYAFVNHNTATLASLCPDLQEYYILDRYRSAYFKALKSINKLKCKYFIGTIPSNVIRDAFLPIFLRIPIRIKHTSPHKEIYRNYDFLFNKKIELDVSLNDTDSNLMLLRMIDSNFDMEKKVFNLRPIDKAISDVKGKLIDMGYSSEKMLIGIHPGCKKTWSFKRWPPERFAELINSLTSIENSQVILFGGPDEIDLAEIIISKTRIKPIDLINKLNLEETLYAINFCAIFVSNDSGLMHMASALDIPVVGLFGGSSNEKRKGPCGKRNIILKKEKIGSITVDEVHKTVIEILKQEISQG